MKRPLWIRGVGSANFSASPSAIAPTSSGMKSSRSRSRSLRETVSRTGLWTDSPIGNRSGARVHPATVGVRNNGRADPGLLAHGRPLPDLKQGRRLSLMRARPTRGRRNDTFDGQGGRPRHPATADSRYLLARTALCRCRSRGARCARLWCGRRTLGRYGVARCWQSPCVESAAGVAMQPQTLALARLVDGGQYLPVFGKFFRAGAPDDLCLALAAAGRFSRRLDPARVFVT